MSPREILEAMPQNTLKAIVYDSLRAIERENWYEWKSGEAFTWMQNQMTARGYNHAESEALALLAMQEFLKSRNA